MGRSRRALVGALIVVAVLVPAPVATAAAGGGAGPSSPSSEEPTPVPAAGPTPATGAPARDGDGDGLTDEDELTGTVNRWPAGLPGLAVAGDPTDPSDPDTDGDGLSDAAEVGTSVDPRGSAATGTDPNAVDTDGDGVGDGEEVTGGSDPMMADSDRDGLTDDEEPALGTDPVRADSDYDGGADGVEVAAGADPLDPSGTEPGPFRFPDVRFGVPYFYPVYWAVAAGVVARGPRFVPEGVLDRANTAVFVRKWVAFLGEDTPDLPNRFTDTRDLRRRVQRAIAWVSDPATRILPARSRDRFAPEGVLTRAEVALVLLRASAWAGLPTAPARDSFLDTRRLPRAQREAIGWLQDLRVVQGRRFEPARAVTRAGFVTLLFRLGNALRIPRPGVDTDGDGLTDVLETRGGRNQYPAFVDTDGDGLSDVLEGIDPEPDPLAPRTTAGVDDTTDCVAPIGHGVALPLDGSFRGGATDLADPDSDDDGISDGQEVLVVETDPNDPDTDNDCLNDAEEGIGWKIVIDGDGQGCPGGGGGGCPDIVRYDGFADPLTIDGDGDGLPDGEERLLRTDAELADTDLDSLDDFVEWYRWFTSPNSVDSDQDSRGGDRNLPPTESLFDGIELRDVGTSPTLEDTDGDGASDGDELDSPTRNPLLAELPEFEMELAGGTSIRLVKQREASQGGSIAVGLTNSTESTTANSETSSVTQRETNTLGVSASFTVGYENAAFKAEATVGFEYTHEWGTDTTREFSSEESQTIAQERSRTEEDNWTSVEAAVSGQISQGMVFRNTGTFTYELSDVGYALLLQDPQTDEYEVVGTMTVPLDGITLGPGARTGPIQVVADDLDVDLIESFLASPRTLHFVTSNIEFLDEEGRNFDFLTERTFGQTAQIVVDFGEGRQEAYDVATNVIRAEPGTPDNELRRFPGVPMRGRDPADDAYLQGVMDQIGYPRCEAGPAPGCYTTDGTGALQSVDGLANTPPGGPDCAANWQVITQTNEQAAAAFDDMVVKAGDRIRLVRQTDCDTDQLSDSVESGDCLEATDCDLDGLTDLEEAEGWIVGLPDADAGGVPCADQPAPRRDDATASCPLARPNPRLADSDLDGVGDLAERDGTGRTVGVEAIDLRTNPLDPDSDGDTYTDVCTPAAGDCAAPGDAAPLHSSLRRVDATPCAPAPGCWATTSPDLGATLASAGGSAGGDPRDDVKSVWVAQGTYVAPPGGFVLPAGVGVYGGFTGNEARLRDRNPDPTGPAAARLVGNGADTVAVVNASGVTDAVLDGVRVQGGTQGGVVGTGSTVILRNLMVSNNAAPEGPGRTQAGGITWRGGRLTAENLTVTTNTGPSGGMRADGGAVVDLADARLRSNESLGESCATTPAPACLGGGGLSVEGAEVGLDQVTVRDNTALVGGGIDVRGPGSVLRVVTSEIVHNTARGDDTVAGRGAGLHAHDGARVLASNCLVADNQAIVGPLADDPLADGFGGGVFAFDDADVRVINCTVAGNRGGGALVAGDERSSDDIDPLNPTNLPSSTSHLVHVLQPANATAEVQRLRVEATGGTFRVTYAGQTTPPLAFDVSAAALQTALEALDSVDPGDVVVTGGPGDETGTAPYVLTWAVDLGDIDPPPTVDDTALIGGAARATVATQTNGAGTWRPRPVEVEGARATFTNSLVYGNTMAWQPTFIAYRQACDANRCPLDEVQRVGSGLLGSWLEVAECLGATRNSFLNAFGLERQCVYVGFAGLSFSSSTELRSDYVAQSATRGVRLVNTMVGAGSRHGDNRNDRGDIFGTVVICPTDYFGRSEVPTVRSDRGSVVCEDDEPAEPDPVEYDIYVGLRGRGFVGQSVTSPVPAPSLAADPADFYASGYVPRASTVAVNRGNEGVDFDPFTPGVQDPPTLDLLGRPRIVGAQIDLGPFEVQ